MLLDEYFGVQYLVKLSIQLVSVRFELISLLLDIAVDLLEGVLEALFKARRLLSGIVLDCIHLFSDHLQLSLDLLLFLCQAEILTVCFCRCIRVSNVNL